MSKDGLPDASRKEPGIGKVIENSDTGIHIQSVKRGDEPY